MKNIDKTRSKGNFDIRNETGGRKLRGGRKEKWFVFGGVAKVLFNRVRLNTSCKTHEEEWGERWSGV